MTDGMIKRAVTYSAILAGSASLGAYKGFNAAQGNDVSLAVDAALIGVPLASGAAAGMICPETPRSIGRGTGNVSVDMLMIGLSAGASMLEMAVYGIGGGVGSALAEGVGIGAGYLAGYFAR